MPRELIIRPEAEAELVEAFEWYESRVQGLGAEFLLAIDATLANILRNPLQHPLVHKTVRRALLRRFPYEIFFVLGDLHIVILAVFHAKRNPKQWTDRI
ncbi:MAG: type II toxin-antitoxin system RelE/ParE family toxin [bacterium]